MISFSIAQWAFGFAFHSIDPEMRKEKPEVMTENKPTTTVDEAKTPVHDWPNSMGVCEVSMKLGNSILADQGVVRHCSRRA